MKRQILISMSALCMLAACTPAQKPEIQEPTENVIHFTATLAPKGENPQSKAITTGMEGGKEVLNVAWAVGEEIAVYYQTSGGYMTEKATVQSVTNGVATITADLTGAIDGSSVSLVYPASLHNDMGGINETALLNQNGNLTGANGISTKFDAAIGTSTITLIDGWNASVSDMVTMTNQVCICKFHFDIVESYGMGGSTRNFSTPVIINDGNGHEYTITSDRTDGGPRGFNSTDDIYVALLPVSNSTVTFSTTYSPNSYSYTSTGTVLEAGKYYRNLSIYMVKGGYTHNNGILSTIVIQAGETYTLNNEVVNVSSGPAIQCNGDATLIIEGTNYVTASAYGQPAIYIPVGCTLTIKGTGMLTAKSTGEDGSGIGSGHSPSCFNCGNIIIESGTVTATGNAYGAGIGSSHYGECGTITINGGTVTATGGDYGAGIGGCCGAITINGGTVTATGNAYGAGIGSEMGTCATITINGGTITATGGDHAAGIGSGVLGTCGDITIGSGLVSLTATMGLDSEAPIGSGKHNSTCGTITIDGLTPGNWAEGWATDHYNWTVSTVLNGGNVVTRWTLTHK